jgi:hypothetical protein
MPSTSSIAREGDDRATLKRASIVRLRVVRRMCVFASSAACASSRRPPRVRLRVVRGARVFASCAVVRGAQKIAPWRP